MDDVVGSRNHDAYLRSDMKLQTEREREGASAEEYGMVPVRAHLHASLY